MSGHAPSIAALHACLTQALAPERLEIADDSPQHAGHAAAGGGGHFTVTVVSAHFTGKSLVERHRMVYAAVGDMFNAQHIHALSIRAYTPVEATSST